MIHKTDRLHHLHHLNQMFLKYQIFLMNLPILLNQRTLPILLNLWNQLILNYQMIQMNQ